MVVILFGVYLQPNSYVLSPMSYVLSPKHLAVTLTDKKEVPPEQPPSLDRVVLNDLVPALTKIALGSLPQARPH